MGRRTYTHHYILLGTRIIHRRDTMTNVITLLLVFIVASTNVVVEGRKRAARVRIGNHYKQHDPVHIIVNKVGYVILE